MPTLVFVLYLMLCVRMTVDVRFGVGGTQGSLCASVSTLMFCADYEGTADFSAPVPRLNARYLPELPKMDKGKMRTAFPWLKGLLHAAHWEKIVLHMRIGTQEAWSTAMAAGMARAAIYSALAGMGKIEQSDIRVEPDFSAPVWVAAGQCIFSLQLGDIMAAAIKTAAKTSRKEGKA